MRKIVLSLAISFLLGSILAWQVNKRSELVFAGDMATQPQLANATAQPAAPNVGPGRALAEGVSASQHTDPVPEAKAPDNATVSKQAVTAPTPAALEKASPAHAPAHGKKAKRH